MLNIPYMDSMGKEMHQEISSKFQNVQFAQPGKYHPREDVRHRMQEFSGATTKNLPSLKTNMTGWKAKPFEDVSPTKNGDFPACHLGFPNTNILGYQIFVHKYIDRQIFHT